MIDFESDSKTVCKLDTRFCRNHGENLKHMGNLNVRYIRMSRNR